MVFFFLCQISNICVIALQQKTEIAQLLMTVQTVLLQISSFVLLQENLIREQTQQHDETYYLWALSFFMAFNRGSSFRADLVSETMSIRAFHFIERNITNYYEMLLTDRKEATSWSRR